MGHPGLPGLAPGWARGRAFQAAKGVLLIPSWLSLLLSAALALIFAWAGLTKVLGPERWRKDLQAYRLSRPFRAAGLLLVPWLELGITAAVLAGYPRLAAWVALALLVTFSLAIVRARVLVGTNQLACGCFGGHTTRDYRVLLARNAGLGLLAAVVATFPVPFITGTGGAVPVALVLAGALTLGAAGWGLWQLRTRGQDARRPAGSA